MRFPAGAQGTSSDQVDVLNSGGPSRALGVDARPAGRGREKESPVRDDASQLTIGEVASRAGMRTSRIRYYEAQDLLPVPDRVSGKRRYSAGVLRQLAIIDAAQRVGFTLDEIRELLGSRDRPAHERARRLAQRKLPEVDALIERATAVRRLLEACSACDCGSLDVCELFDDHQLRLTDHSAGAVASRLVALRDDVRGDSSATAYP